MYFSGLMGCLKLAYNQHKSPLKVVHRADGQQEKPVQRFISVDPMAHMRSWLSPYNFVQNNPLNRIDPNGALDTKFEDERGNLLYETKDNVDATVVVANDKVDDFKQEVSQLGDNTLYNVFEEKKTTVNLASNYMKEGQAVSYTIDGQGNISNLAVGEAATYNVNQIGISGVAAAGPFGGYAEAGIAWDSKGNVNFYSETGSADGIDFSGGIVFTGNTSYSSDFNVNSLKGYGGQLNGAGWFLDVGQGGDRVNRETSFAFPGLSYKSNSLGFSVGANIGATRTKGYTKIYKKK